MKRNDILYILIPGCILMFIWIGFNIAHNAATSTIPETTSIQIAPIIPEFDIETISSIKQRKRVEPVSEFGNKSTTSATPSSQTIATESAIKATRSAQ